MLPSSKLLVPDNATRDAAVQSLRLFLVGTAEKSMDKREMAKLWKGIFYCSSCLVYRLYFSCQRLTSKMPGFWLSDKPLVQQELSADLAELLLDIPTADASFDFLRGFWEAIVREWSGLDYIRSVAKAWEEPDEAEVACKCLQN